MTSSQQKLSESGCTGYSTLLDCEEFKNYINDPFDKNVTETYLEKSSPKNNMQGTKGHCCYPPYRITYESLTFDVGTVIQQERKLDVLHYNAFLLVPRFVYHLSTKLKNDAIHNRIGKKEEVDLIKFLTRYGYGTRTAPFCKLHGVYGTYTNMTNVAYVNNCEG
jgi:hypothetical protein